MNQVLVVDDEQEVVSMLSRNLSLEGFAVHGATSKNEALREMRENLPSIVLLDIRFPETNGPELLKAFKEINPLVNVVMITGYSNMANVVDCLGGGAVDYFTKPLDLDRVVQRLKQIERKLERWRNSMKV